MSEVRNTTADDPIVNLMVGASPGGIEAQEAAGQAQVVNSTKLPKAREGDDGPFIELGFEFGEMASGDDLFREAKLPEGWAREGSDHSMWSYIVDERGFRRVAIFYKAAFYDRRAEMSVVRQPFTRAQEDTYEAFNVWCPWESWTVEARKDGDNKVWVGQEVEVENGSKVFDHDARDWKRTGLVRERVIAPDGSTVSEREYNA